MGVEETSRIHTSETSSPPRDLPLVVEIVGKREKREDSMDHIEDAVRGRPVTIEKAKVRFYGGIEK